MAVAADADYRAVVARELESTPDEAMPEILDFVRFIKHQLSGLSPEGRFDRAWLIARRIARERGITDTDVVNEVAAFRLGE